MSSIDRERLGAARPAIADDLTMRMPLSTTRQKSALPLYEASSTRTNGHLQALLESTESGFVRGIRDTVNLGVTEVCKPKFTISTKI
jgi:hypothetical protein